MYDACVCVDYDGAPAEFFSQRIIRARKDHKCIECDDVIKKGSKYEYTAGKWEGDFDTFKTCLTCVNVRKDLFQCGINYGMMWEDIRMSFLDALPAGEKDDMEWLY